MFNSNSCAWANFNFKLFDTYLGKFKRVYHVYDTIGKPIFTKKTKYCIHKIYLNTQIIIIYFLYDIKKDTYLGLFSDKLVNNSRNRLGFVLFW